MKRLTIRLPGALHEQLRVTEEEVREQRERYSALLERLGEAAFPEIKEALAGRETVDGEEGLSPEVVERLKNRTAGPMG